VGVATGIRGENVEKRFFPVAGKGAAEDFFCAFGRRLKYVFFSPGTAGFSVGWLGMGFLVASTPRKGRAVFSKGQAGGEPRETVMRARLTPAASEKRGVRNFSATSPQIIFLSRGPQRLIPSGFSRGRGGAPCWPAAAAPHLPGRGEPGERPWGRRSTHAVPV